MSVRAADPLHRPSRRAALAILAVGALAVGLAACKRNPYDEHLGVVSTVPPDGAIAVPPDLVVEVTFDDRLDPAFVGTSKISVVSPDGPVTGTVEVTGSGRILRFTASQQVKRLVTVDVTVRKGIAGTRGEILDRDVGFSFRTNGSELLLNRDRLIGLAGTSTSISATLLGDAGTEPATAVSWTSFDPSVAYVDTSSQTAMVRFAGPGYTTIRAESQGLSTTIPASTATATAGGVSFLVTDAAWTDGTFDPDRDLLHTWDVDPCDGSVRDGGAGQFDGASRLILDPLSADSSFGCAGGGVPVFGAPFEVIPSLRQETSGAWLGVVDAGSSSCHLRPIGRASMYQDVTVPASATSGLTLSWSDRYALEPAGSTTAVRASVQNLTDGAPAVVVFSIASAGTIADGGGFSPRSIGLTAQALAGKTARIRFEAIGGGYEGSVDEGRAGLYLDGLSLELFDATELFDDPGCEVDPRDPGAGWTGEYVRVPREATFGPRSVDGLLVSRSVYAPYSDGYWLRSLETIENAGGTTRAVTVRLEGELGSGGSGQYATDGEIFLSFDGGPGAHPSVAMLPGAYDRIGSIVGADGWSSEYDLSLAPGEARSILTYQLFGASTDVQDLGFLDQLATEILDSVRNLGIDSPYAAGISPEEWAQIANGP